MLVIEIINTIGHPPISWILDFGVTSQICVCIKDLEESMPLQKREVILRVGNGAIVDPLVIGTTSVLLSSKHVLNLKDCLYLLDPLWNVMSIQRLVKDNYVFSFTNDMCYIHCSNECVGMQKL